MNLKDVRVASGVLIRTGSRRFIVTAAHFLKDVSVEEMTVLFRSEETQSARTLGELKSKLTAQPGLSKQGPVAVPINGIATRVGSPLEDVAVIEIAPGIIPKWCWTYDPNEHGSEHTLPMDGEELILSGMPSMASVIERPSGSAADAPDSPLDFGRSCMIKLVSTTSVPDPSQWVDENQAPAFNPTMHFAVAYDLKDPYTEFHPGGLSGCGLWRINFASSTGGVSVPSPVLLGIENSYKESAHALKATGFRRVLPLLV